jgi:hypothetical protein
MLKHTLLVILGALVFTGLSPIYPALAEECSQGGRTSGDCASIDAEVGENSVLISATVSTPGSSGATSTVSPAPSTPPRTPWTRPAPRAPVLGTSECTVIVAGRCRAGSPSRAPVASRPTPTRVVVAPTPPSQISDLVQFQPATTGLVLEPGSWSLPRIPTNMYSTATTQQVSGLLLGFPIEVRFTPHRFHWNYGDGVGGSSVGAGSSWGPRQFSATSTSHVYRAPGTYVLSVSVDYLVAYRFSGSDFVPLSGTVSQSGGRQILQVLRVSPVLVDKGCEPRELQEGRC